MRAPTLRNTENSRDSRISVFSAISGLAEAQIAAQHIDDGGGGGDLRGHGAHHGEGHHCSQDQLCRLAEAALKQVRDGCDAILPANVRDPPGVACKEEHTQQIGDRRQDGLGAAGVGHAGPAHEAAAADDGGADRGHQLHGA